MAPASETYTKRLLTKGHGYPLWRPDLDENLPEEYITQGIRIGDLGVISNGAFRYLFNICVPAEHPINRDRTPRNFQHLDLGPEPSPSPSPPSQLGQIGTKYIEHHSHGHRKPSIISSIHNSNLQLSGNIALDAPVIPVEAGVELQLQATSSEGAALILPDGGSKSDLKPLGKFRKYALQNGVSWYQHLNGTEEWDAPNGSLYLVTGCDKSKAWAVFSFSNQVQGASVSLKLVATMVGGAGGGLSYSWQTQDSAEARCYPELPSSPANESGPMLISESANVPAPQAQNQCVFIRGFKIALRTPLYLKLFQSIELSNIVNEGFNPGHQRYIPFAGNAQPSSSAGLLGLRRPANKQGGQTRLTVTALELEPPTDETDVLLKSMTEMNDTEVLVDHFPQESQPYHPSNIINDYLLKNTPDTNIAITHDNEWIAFTKDLGFNDELLVDDRLLEWIISKYDIENQDGASFLAAKNPGTSVTYGQEASSGKAHVANTNLRSNIDARTSRIFPAPNMFQYASQVTIQGGTFNSVGAENLETGLDKLSQAASLGAIHDSAERYPPPNCHPDTRKAVRQVILDWIYKKSSALPFFWLYGPAGAGKTAILHAIADFLSSSSEDDGDLGGSFFFSRGKSGRDQGHFLFLTIAYQLALKVPGLRLHTNRIMEVNPTLPTKSIAVQLQTLVVDALQSLSPLPQRSFLVIIDGLDECQDQATQQLILRLLCETITTRRLPLRFIIGSRPESHIRASFDEEALYKITQRVALDETFNPGKDIQVFLEDGFAEICAKHADILSHERQPWPGPGIIYLLVQRSSGQFIYAATVLKFVGADFCSPTKQLELVLKPSSKAFSDLDQLYTQILSVYPSTANIVQILGIIVAFDNRNMTPEMIEDVLGMEEGEVKLVLRGLSSLITDGKERYLDKRDGSVHLIHTSFRDYLVDSSRSGPFYVNEQDHKNRATMWSFALITRWIGRSWRISSTTRLPHSKTWDYFKSHLVWDFIESPNIVEDAIMTDINDLVQEFWKVSSGGEVDVFFTAMHCLMEILEGVAELLKLDSVELQANDDEFFRVFHGYQEILDQSFISAFSKSDINDLLRFLPGIVVQKSLTMEGMAELYRVKMDLLEHLSRYTFQPFSKGIAPSDMGTHPSYTLERCLSNFLRDRDRSHLYYCDPMLHHVFICHQFLSLLDGSNASDLQSDDLAAYVQYNLYEHLCAATEIFLSGQNIPGDHPAVEIFNDLDRATYSHFHSNQSHYISYLAQCTIWPVLRWAETLNNRLKGMTVLVPGFNLMERMCQLTDKIYREILFIETHGSMMTLQATICAPLRIIGPDIVIPETPPCRAPNPGVHLSWELLAWVSMEGRIPSSFTDFMTTSERSGPLYISPDVYHTQITEYSLETIFRHYNSDNFRPSPFSLDNDHHLELDWSFKEHISHAVPTEMILYLLPSIHSLDLDLVPPYTPESTLNLLEIVIKWLEGLGSKRPSDLYNRFQGKLNEKLF